MAKVRFELNHKGVIELMKSPEMTAICKEYADNAQSMLGDGYIVTTYPGKTRTNASIYAESDEAKRENLEDNTILKALGGNA